MKGQLPQRPNWYRSWVQPHHPPAGAAWPVGERDAALTPATLVSSVPASQPGQVGAGGAQVSRRGSNVYLASDLCTCLRLPTCGKSTDLNTCYVPALSWADTTPVLRAKVLVCVWWGQIHQRPFQVRSGLGLYSQCGGSPWRVTEDGSGGRGRVGARFRLPLRTMQFHSDHQVAGLSLVSSSETFPGPEVRGFLLTPQRVRGHPGPHGARASQSSALAAEDAPELSHAW